MGNLSEEGKNDPAKLDADLAELGVNVGDLEI